MSTSALNRYPSQTSTMARIYISKRGFILRPIVRRWVLYALVLGVTLIVLALLLPNSDALAKPETYGGLAAVGAVIFGYWQWREGRHEEAVDHFFERLNHATDTFLASLRANTPYQNAVAREYVYAELNNLEYSLEKYRLGYMRPELAARALRTFEDRCRCSKDGLGGTDFAESVRDIVQQARSASRDFSYNELTLQVAESVLRHLESNPLEVNVDVRWRERLKYFLDLK